VIYFAREAYFKVEIVSYTLYKDGDTVAIITVLAFPPKLSCKSLVSLESLYGIKVPFPSTRAEITFPNAVSDKLILVA